MNCSIKVNSTNEYQRRIDDEDMEGDLLGPETSRIEKRRAKKKSSH